MNGKQWLALIFILIQCKSYESFQYVAEQKNELQKTKLKQVVAIIPFTDLRKEENISFSGVSLIPLIFWEKTEFNKDVPKKEKIFRTKDLRYAILDEFKSYQLFSEVFLTEGIAPYEVDYLVKGEILSTKNTSYISFYGLSFLGLSLAILGVPIIYNTSELQIRLEFVEYKTGKILYAKEYRKSHFRITGFYYNLNAPYKGYSVSALEIFPDFVRDSIHSLAIQ